MSELNAQKQIVGDLQTRYNKVVDGSKPVIQVVPTRLIQAFYNKLLRLRACHQLVNDFSTSLVPRRFFCKENIILNSMLFDDII